MSNETPPSSSSTARSPICELERRHRRLHDRGVDAIAVANPLRSVRATRRTSET